MDCNQNIDELIKAANQGDPLAMANLCKIYAEGVVVKKDLAYAIYCFVCAVGFGVPQNIFDDAINTLFEKVEFKDIVSLAESGNPDVQYFVGLCYGDGIGTEQNAQEAVYWYRKAAMQNHSLALFMYGVRLWIGNGTEKDLFLAEKVLRQAVRQGALGASKYLEEVETEKNATVPYYLVKITDAQWADMMMNGDIFMRTLEEFARFENEDENEIFDESKKDTFRKDTLEGLVVSQHTMPLYLPENGGLKKINVPAGLVDALTLHEKVFCLYTLEYDEKNMCFVKPNPRLRDFGDTAIVITDAEKFLSRIFDALKEKYGDKFWWAYKRVSYNIDIFKEGKYSEFCKQPSYSWQNEFRIAIDISDGKFSNEFFHKESTDYAMITFLNNGGMIDNDNGVKSDDNSITLKIDVSDICVKMPVSELLYLKHNLFKIIPPSKVNPLEKKREPRPTLTKRVLVGDDSRLIFTAQYLDSVIL